MAIFDKFLKSVRLVDDEDYDDDYEYEDEYEDEEEEKEKRSFFRFGRKNKDVEDEVEEEPVRGKLTPMRGGKSSHRMEVCVIRPASFEDVKEIADTLLSNRTVILNMEGVDLALAQRIIDFMTGSCYAIDGNLRRINNHIFILTPASVDISGDFQGLVNAFETSTTSQSMNTLKAVGGVSSY